MAITKEVVIDQITVLEDGQIQVREATRILEDGERISETFHRHVVPPGADLDQEDARVKQVGGVVHTSDVITAWNDYMESIAIPADSAP